MILKRLQIHQFKNYTDRSFSFSPKINCFVGKNGIGKTNILEAIHYMALTKGFANSLDKHNIQFNKDYFILEALIKHNDSEDKVSCIVNTGRKKKIKKNEADIVKIADYIGYLPLVMISPYDRDLITESADSRRKYIDSILSQVDKVYLNTLIAYNKTLQQRNSLLKYFAKNHCFDKAQLDVYNFQLKDYAAYIFDKRKIYVDEVRARFKTQYALISNQSEEVDINYKSQLLDAPLDVLLDQFLDKDRILQHTSTGIHRDDLVFTINGNPIKRFGSQGQQKSLLIALKLAQYDYLKQQAKVKPILLLDDVFDKLDEHRVEAIIDLVNSDYFGQIFITDTHKDRIEHLLSKLEVESNLVELS